MYVVIVINSDAPITLPWIGNVGKMWIVCSLRR
jgi:hypothetical protein